MESVENKGGTLYIVPTPIGHLDDITLRALKVLQSVDLIACEDTRHSLKLLNHYGIKAHRISYHEHNQRKRTDEIIGRIQQGEEVALISDAGMPVLSDPGDILLEEALKRGVRISVLPGANAALTALVGSGLSAKEFTFAGFVPRKQGERGEALREALGSKRTTIFYESPKRLLSTLAEIAQLQPDWRIVVARELTKLHEDLIRGTAEEVYAHFEALGVRGEIVLLLSGGALLPASQADVLDVLRERMEQGHSHSRAVKEVAKEFGLSRNELYEISLAGKEKPGDQ